MSMQTIVPETQDEILEFQQWYLKKTREIERDRRKLEDDKQRLEMQRGARCDIRDTRGGECI